MRTFPFAALFFFSFTASAQYDTNTKQENRDRLYRNIVSNTILKNLSGDLSDSTRDDWASAFTAMAMIGYRDSFTETRVMQALKEYRNGNFSFKKSLLELTHAQYRNSYSAFLRKAMQKEREPELFAYAANGVLLSRDHDDSANVRIIALRGFDDTTENIFIQSLRKIFLSKVAIGPKNISLFFDSTYLHGNVLMISMQSSDRNFPGIVLIRDSAGKFVCNDAGSVFSVPQLARSISNMPYYLHDGNTPQGIYRMSGTAISKSLFLGKTPNIQLTLPFEYKAGHFFRDSTLADSVWRIEKYISLLPADFLKEQAMLEAWDAGRAGRSAIIAHGTTVDPQWYKGQSYYPLIPGNGCLTAKEIWSGVNGVLTDSDQKKLLDAITKAGGANGYAIVINVSERSAPVTLADILPYMTRAALRR